MIDPAMLRTGRLDKKFYLPHPILKRKKAMFEMYLKTVRLDFGLWPPCQINRNYVSSDIEFW